MPEVFNTTQLQEALQSLHRPPRFLLDFFFPNVITFDTQDVRFDQLSDDFALAPFVSPSVPGVAESPKGYETKSFIPAYVKPKHVVDPSRPLVRSAGEQIGGSLSAGQRRLMIINDLLALQRDRIIRRMEWMAAQVLTTGKVVVVGDKYPSQTVDFDRKTTFTKALVTTARWGETGVVPSTDIDTWADELATEIGAGVNVVIMGKDAWKLLIADEKFEKMLDRQKGQDALINLGYQTGAPGVPQYKGRVGDMDFYTYNGTYKNSNGTTQTMLDSYGIIMAASEAHHGFRLHGAILDGAAGYQPNEFFSKNWIENDPAVEFVMTQSAPLVAPGRPNAARYIKVR